MEIVVKQINSKNAEKLKCKVDPQDKVSVLRRLVADNLGTDEANIKLIFKGRFLKDETDLEMHGALDLWSFFPFFKRAKKRSDSQIQVLE